MDKLEIIRKYAGSLSDALLDPDCFFFESEGIEGIIGYKKTKNCFIVIGDPVSNNDDKLKLAMAFDHYCKQLHKTPLYFIASKGFLDQSYLSKITKAYICFGKEFYLNPQKNPKKLTGSHACLIRRKIKHSQNEGVEVKEYKDFDKKIELDSEHIAKVWLDSRTGFQAYISHVRLFDNRSGKRWLFATHKEKIIAVVVLNQVKDKQGWHLNHLMTLPNSPNGTSEALVQKAIDILEDEGCQFLSFGQSPSNKDFDSFGFNKITTLFIKIIFKLFLKLSNLDKHSVFWEKFEPDSKPTYILFPTHTIHIKELWALVKAINLEIK